MSAADTNPPTRSNAESTPELPPSGSVSGGFDPRSIDAGRIECLQVLDELGNVDAGLDPGYPDEELLRVHRAMVLTRAFDARMFAMQRQGQIGTFAPSLGQEACMIGQVWPLGQDDWFSPSYRSLGSQIWRGWPMDRLMMLWAGYHDGFPPPEGVNDLPFSIVIGSHVLPAAGIAMGMRRANDQHCVVVNFGDGAFSQGAVAEALNFAAVDNAPIVFVCENNGWAISTPIEKQAGTDVLAMRGLGYGVRSLRVDGNDMLAMMLAMDEACARARNGQGPTLIEAITFRMSLHTTADDSTVYRDESLVEPWKKRCPILRFELYLTGKNLLTPQRADEIRNECEQEVLDARSRFREAAKADPRAIFDHLYTTIPNELEEQRLAYLRRLDRKGVK